MKTLITKQLCLLAVSFAFFACSNEVSGGSGGNLQRGDSSSSGGGSNVVSSSSEVENSEISSSSIDDGNVVSSSSSTGGGGEVSSSSSNSGNVVSSSSGGSCDTNSGSYKTVKIGTQTWMAENLNCNVEGSKCNGENENNCDIYGRLYDWATAMNLPSSCNSNSCSSQIKSKHQGICPSGWHIPTTAELVVLVDYAGGSSTAGTYLKATSGWNSYNGATGNGKDTYGFAALPGGSYASGNVGNIGYLWSASEYYAIGAYYLGMYYDHESAYNLSNIKSALFSVRCIKD